jgi:hypothetical protein
VNLNGSCAVVDVVVRHDVAVGGDDESGSAGDLLLLVVIVSRDFSVRAALAVAARIGEEEVEGIGSERSALRRSLVLMISVDRIETTAGMTRAATSAKDGIVTVGTGALERVAGTADDCAFDAFMKPRSALSTTPKATEAMMIAIVDRIRLVVGRIFTKLLRKNGNRLSLGLSAHFAPTG